jgi:hypothetical protein
MSTATPSEPSARPAPEPEAPQTVTIVTPGHTDPDWGLDCLYIHGAQIADPHNNPDVTWDWSTEPAEPVYVLRVEPAEDETPYVAALEALGVEVVERTADGWVGHQTRTL